MIRYVFFAAILIFITFTLYLAFSSAEAEAEAGDKNRLNNKKSYPLGWENQKWNEKNWNSEQQPMNYAIASIIIWNME